MLVRPQAMQPDWSSEDLYVRGGQEQFGQHAIDQQFLERCTSAPLPPSSYEKSKKSHAGNMLVGNDLLEHVSRGYFENSYSETATPLMANGIQNSGAGQIDFGADLLFGPALTSGRSTAPDTSLSGGFGLSRPLSANGNEFQVGQSFHKLHEMNALDNDNIPGGGNMRRSRSASAHPQYNLDDALSMQPPPGLSPQSGSNNNHINTNREAAQGIRRPASTGVISSSSKQDSVLRPASKTLMELIQEDGPHDDQGAIRARHGIDGLSRSTASPMIERPSPRQFDQGVSPDFPSQELYAGSNFDQEYRGDPKRHGLLDNQYGNSFQSRDQQQYTIQQLGGGSATPSHHNPYAGAQQQALNPLQQPKHLVMHSTEQQVVTDINGAPQLVYTNQQAPKRLEHTINLRNQVQQPRQLVQPTSQPIYVNNVAGQAGYSYAPIQYAPAAPQQQPIIQQQLTSNGFNGRGEQYISVVPIQGDGTQLAYWQQTDRTQRIGATTYAIVNAPGGPVGTQINVGRFPIEGHATHGHSGYGGGRHGRGPGGDKGGRGRRGAQTRRGDSAKGGNHPHSSPLLEEFRNSKTRDWTMRRIEGYVLEFCQDQNGSRFIQQRLELGDPVEQDIVMKEVIPTIRRLRNDVFGNYVVQKLLDFGTPQMKSDIRQTLEGEMLQLSLQMYGCRVVQKALETLSEDELPRLLMEFHHNVLSCIHDQNGNHVIQKCIEVMYSRAKSSEAACDFDHAYFLKEQIEFIFQDVLVNAATLSSHPYGCRVLQRLLEYCDEKKKSILLDEIQSNHRKLLDDQYGNYVIQHVLQFGRDIDRDSILLIIQENGLLGLARQKFASNVVEKLLKHGNGAQRRAIAREMLNVVTPTSGTYISEPTEIGRSVAILMVRDAYANYVVQTTLDVAPESEERTLLLKELNAHSEELKNYTFAKHIVSKLATLNTVDV